MSDPQQQRIIGASPDLPAEIGRWPWCLDDAGRRMLPCIERVDPRLVDWEASAGGNRIGTNLYHIAVNETDYLYAKHRGELAAMRTSAEAAGTT